jgi:hypothetical protein
VAAAPCSAAGTIRLRGAAPPRSLANRRVTVIRPIWIHLRRGTQAADRRSPRPRQPRPDAFHPAAHRRWWPTLRHNRARPLRLGTVSASDQDTSRDLPIPTCTVPAERCDLDHHEPLPSGRHPAATWTRSADHTTGVKPSPGRHASETTSASTGPCPTPKPIDASTSPCQPAERPDGDLAHAAPAKIGGSRNSMLSDHVMWVRMGASMPPEARRCSATTVPRTTAAKTSTGLPPAIVVDA